MRFSRAILLGSLLLTAPAFAGPPSIIGGKQLGSGTAHHFGVGWPSLYYEWWNGGGAMDWALGAELVYGDWSGEYSNVDVGLAFNFPMKFHLSNSGIWHTAFLLKPGVLIGDDDDDRRGRRDDDDFVFGARPEVGILISADMHRIVNLVTGVVSPVTLLFVENQDPKFIFPILGRIGVEVRPSDPASVWFLAEIGPTVCASDDPVCRGDDFDVEVGFRFWMGATIW